MSFEFGDLLWPWQKKIAMPDGTTEKLFNGKFDIAMDGVNSWILGLPFGSPFTGRNTNILASERKVVVAWQCLFGLEGPGEVETLKWYQGLPFGLAGAVDVIAHNKILLNYYGQNITVERKSHPEFVFKSRFEKAGFGERLLRASLLRYGFLVLALSVVAARILYLINRDANSLAITILQAAVPFLEVRWLFYVVFLEKGYGVADKLVKETDAANARLAVDQEKLLALTNAALGAAPLLVAQGGLATRVLGTHTKNLLGLGAGVAREVENVLGVVGEHAGILV